MLKAKEELYYNLFFKSWPENPLDITSLRRKNTSFDPKK